MFTSVAVYPSGTVSEDAAVKIFIEGLHHLIPQAPILVLELGFPLELEVVSGVVDDLVEHRGFRCASPVMLELFLCLLPRVAPEHTGWFGELRLVGVLDLGRSADRDSGEASGKAVSKDSLEKTRKQQEAVVGRGNLPTLEDLAVAFAVNWIATGEPLFGWYDNRCVHRRGPVRFFTCNGSMPISYLVSKASGCLQRCGKRGSSTS